MSKEYALIYSQETSLLAKRVTRTQDFMRMFTRNPRSIQQTLEDILSPRTVAKEQTTSSFGITDTSQTTEDASIALCYTLQANIMHRNMTPIPNSITRMVASFMPEQHLSAEETILGKLGALAQLPALDSKTHTISFSDPKDTAVFVVASELVRREKGANLTIYLEPKTDEWTETQQLVQRVNKYMSKDKRLELRALSEAPWMNKKTEKKIKSKKKSQSNKELTDTTPDFLDKVILQLQKLQENANTYNKKQIREDKRLSRDGVTIQEMASAIKEGSKYVTFDFNSKTYALQSEHAPVFNEKKIQSPEFFADTIISHTDAFPFLSFLMQKSNGNPIRIARWFKKDARNEITFRRVEKTLFATMERARSQEFGKQFTDALVDDILDGDIYFRKLRKSIAQDYIKTRGNKNMKQALEELRHLPIMSIVGKTVILNTIEQLAAETATQIRLRRNEFRTEGSDRDDFNLEEHEAKLRAQGLNVVYNDPITEAEMNMRPSAEYRQDRSDLLDLMEPARADDDVYTATPQSLYEKRTPELLFKLLIYAGTERSTYPPNKKSPWDGRVVPTYETVKEEEDEKVKVKMYKPLRAKYIDPKKPGRSFLISTTNTGIVVPVQFTDSSRSNGVDLRYFGQLVGSLDTIEIENGEAN